MQRTATPCTPVRFRPQPPFKLFKFTPNCPDGQIANGGVASIAEKSGVLPQKYNLFAVQLEVDLLETSPAPYSRYSGIPISSQVSNGAPSNYIKEMIDKWAPGELP